jgi:predicted nucleotidyltransferase
MMNVRRKVCEEGRATITWMIQRPVTRAAIAEFSSRARACFGPRLVRLVVFGSQARGEATEDSDVDLLVVVDQLTSADGRVVDAIVGDILTAMDVLISPLLLSQARFDELRARERLLIAEIDREGIPV